MSGQAEESELQALIRRQWNSAIGQQVIAKDFEKAAKMGELADFVVNFVDKFVLENSPLICDKLLNGDEVKENTKARSVVPDPTQKSLPKPASSTSEPKQPSRAPSVVSNVSSHSSKNRPPIKTFMKTKENPVKNVLPWPSYVRFEEAQPDQIGDAVWTESNKLMPSNPKRVVILSNYRWSFAGAMEQVMGPKFKRLLDILTAKFPLARYRFLGLYRQDAPSVQSYNTMLFKVCSNYPTVEYVEASAILQSVLGPSVPLPSGSLRSELIVRMLRAVSTAGDWAK